MIDVPINKREFDIFLSHAHKDKNFVDEIDRWLTEKAGLRVWYDARELAGGSSIASGLQVGLGRCRSIFLLASEESLSRPWVKDEYNAAMVQRERHPDFRVVALKLPNANVDELMGGITWISLPSASLDSNTTLAVIHALYPGEKRPNPSTARDIFISASWHQDDNKSAHLVSKCLVKNGFRLIGDSTDQQGFGQGNRVEQIITSCGAFVGIVPYREDTVAHSSKGPYKYFMQELDMATNLGLPTIVVADPRISRSDGTDDEWLRMDTDASECSIDIINKIKILQDEWRFPSNPQNLFYALDLDSSDSRANSPVRHLLERITGMPTIVGNEIRKTPIQAAIRESIRKSFVLLADITDDNLDTCIEAGMGLMAGTNVELISKGSPRRPPFMISGLQMMTFKDDVEKWGVIHSVARRYRRRIINSEI